MQKPIYLSNISAGQTTSQPAFTSHKTLTSPKSFRFALIETLIFLSVAVLLSNVFGNGDRFMAMGLHPFWMIVLLVTLQYGPKEALMAALLSSLFLLAGNLPEQNMTETMYQYILRISFLPFLWITAALALGSLRSRQIMEKQQLQEQLASSEEAKEAIAAAYNCLKQTKEQLELRLAEEKRSILTVYNIAKSLETIDPADALAEVSKLVKTAFNASKFSLYRCDGKGLRLETAHGWGKSSTYASYFDNSTQLARTILGKKRLISIVNEEDESLLGGQGMLAGPIVDPRTGKIFGMLKIEEIAFMDMGIRTHETFNIVCEWIGRIYANVEKYQSIHKRSVQVPFEQNRENKLMALRNMLSYPGPYTHSNPKFAA